MKFLYVLTAAATVALGSCGHAPQAEHDHESHEAGGHEGHDHEAEGHDHEAEAGAKHSEEILLKPEDAKKFGVRVTQLAPRQFSEIIPVSGEIEASAQDQSVVTAPASGILKLRGGMTVGSKIAAGGAVGSISTRGLQGGDPNAVARAEVTAAKREMDRLKTLLEQKLVTRREYDAAVANYNTATARLGSVSAHPVATSAIAGTVTQLLAQDGQYVDMGTPIAVVTRGGQRLTLRADVPERYAPLIPTIRTANFRPAYTDRTLSLEQLGGKLMSAPRGATGTRGYLPVYFSFDASHASAVPGGYAEVYLIGTPRDNAIVVPLEAVTEAQGVNYVYVQLDEEGYEKRPVRLGGSDGERVELLSGVSGGDRVVTAGTTFVRLAETRAVAPEGHSHHH